MLGCLKVVALAEVYRVRGPCVSLIKTTAVSRRCHPHPKLAHPICRIRCRIRRTYSLPTAPDDGSSVCEWLGPAHRIRGSEPRENSSPNDHVCEQYRERPA